jgi:hypothetical protein
MKNGEVLGHKGHLKRVPRVSQAWKTNEPTSPIYRQNKTCCQVRGAFERRVLRSNALPHAFDVLVRVRPQVHHRAASVRV